MIENGKSLFNNKILSKLAYNERNSILFLRFKL